MFLVIKILDSDPDSKDWFTVLFFYSHNAYITIAALRGGHLSGDHLRDDCDPVDSGHLLQHLAEVGAWLDKKSVADPGSGAFLIT